MAERIETPIKACHECWHNYTLSEWDKLETLEEQTEGKPERRACKCGAELELDRDGLEELDLTDDAREYARHHEQTDRVTPEMIAPVQPPPPPPAKPEPPAPKPKPQPEAPTVAMVRASLRRVAPGIRHGVMMWMSRCPRQADAFTLGELRALLGRGPV